MTHPVTAACFTGTCADCRERVARVAHATQLLHARQAVDNLRDALATLDADGAAEEAKVPYRQKLVRALAALDRLEAQKDGGDR